MTNSKYVPKRRFKEFESDGEWELLTLSDISEGFEYGLNVPAKEFDGVNKYLRITDIDDTSREFLKSNLSSPDANCENLGNYRLAEGDVLFARTGASTGKTYYYKETDGKVFFAGFLIRARLKSNFDHRFVFQNTLTKKYKNYIELTSQRSGQPGVNAQEYSRFSLNIPSLSEQKVIGDFVEKLDSLISLHQHKLDKLKNLKKAYLSEMFPTEGERVPKRRFPGFEGEWEQRKLGDIVEINSGKDYKHLIEGEVPVYGTGGYMLSVSEALSYRDGIGIGRKGTIDKPYILRAPFWTVDTLFYCVPKGKDDLQFVNAIFERINWRSYDESTGVPSLSKVIINNIQVFTSCIDEQRTIGDFLLKVEKQITLQQQKLDKLNDLKKAYLNELFV